MTNAEKRKAESQRFPDDDLHLTLSSTCTKKKKKKTTLKPNDYNSRHHKILGHRKIKVVRISYPVKKINCAVTKARCSFRKWKKRSSNVMKGLQIIK